MTQKVLLPIKNVIGSQVWHVPLGLRRSERRITQKKNGSRLGVSVCIVFDDSANRGVIYIRSDKPVDPISRRNAMGRGRCHPLTSGSHYSVAPQMWDQTACRTANHPDLRLSGNQSGNIWVSGGIAKQQFNLRMKTGR